jgi:hypothetical protein
MVQSPSNRLKSYWPRKGAGHRPAPEVQVSKSREWTDWLAQCMSERPVLTLATAALVGLAVGWIVKRK